MTTAILAFEGFAQVRLATDPDPSDEPRGVSGWTTAVAGEPDLDRVIVFQDDHPRRVSRSRGPKVGVAVTGVVVDGVSQPGHPLVGARVELLDDPKFEGRNWIVAVDGREPIDPFRVRISAGDVVLEKHDVVTGSDGAPLPLYRWGPAQLVRRMPRPDNSPASITEIFAALHIPDGAVEPLVRVTAWRNARKEQLKADLRDLPAADVVAAAALQRRIKDIEAESAAIKTAIFRMRFKFDLHGPGRASGPADLFDGTVDTTADWPINFWIGGWDADASCMFVRGELTVALQS